MSAPGASLISAPPDIARVVEAARAAGIVAMDTEFMRERTYRARLCLVQVATGDDIFLIDPLTATDLSQVATLVADPEIEVIVHAGRQDLEIFYERFDVVPSRIFDVQIGAAFAGYGSSLPYGRLVKDVVGARLEKGESYTDWCRRPLTQEQTRYAAADVRYLLPVAGALRAKLERMGRLQWAEEEMAAFEDAATYEMDANQMYKRVAGRGSLTGRQLSVLRELAAWREDTAQKRDLPRGWIVKDPTLIDLARRAPSSIGALKRIRGLSSGEAERSGRDIVAAIERGLRSDEIERIKPFPRAAQARARMLSGPCDAIVKSRCDAAGIATELVATRGELEGLLVDITAGTTDLNGHRLMRGWRRDLAGNDVVAFARGGIAIKATDDPPYIDELEL